MSNVWPGLRGRRVRICGSETEEPPERGKSEEGVNETSQRDWIRVSVQMWGRAGSIVVGVRIRELRVRAGRQSASVWGQAGGGLGGPPG